MKRVREHVTVNPSLTRAVAVRPFNGGGGRIAGSHEQTIGHCAFDRRIEDICDGRFQPGLSVIVLRQDGFERRGWARWNRQAGLRVLEVVSLQ